MSSIIFDVAIPRKIEAKPFSGKVEILNNYMRLSYLNERNLFQVETLDIDLDVIVGLKASLSGTFLYLSGEIPDACVFEKLGKGETIINRVLFFIILKIHYLKTKNSKVESVDFKTIQDVFVDATSKISKTILDVKNKTNFTVVPKPCILKTSKLCYDTHDRTITASDFDDCSWKSHHNSVSVILGECLGKSTIGASILAENCSAKKQWKVQKTKLVVGSSLVVCDIQDLPIYTETFSKKGTIFLIVRTLRQFNTLTYLDLASVDVVIFTSNFAGSLRKEKDLYPYNKEVNLDILLDLNLINRNDIDLNLVKFDLLVIDTVETHRLSSRLSKLSYNCCVKFSSSVSDFIPNSYDTCITLDYTLSSACKIKEFQTSVLNLTKKEKILMKSCANKINVITKDEFLISPETYADYCDVRTKIVSSAQEVSGILQRSDKANFFDKSLECPICFSGCQDQIITHCGHSFCPECAENSFAKKPSCPLCRTAVYPGDYIYLTPKDPLSSAQPSLINKVLSFCKENIGKKIIHTSSRFSAHFLAQILISNEVSCYICCNIGKKLQPQLNAFSKANCEVMITYFDEGQVKKFKISGIKNLLILPDSYSENSSRFITRMSRNGCDIHQIFT